MTVLAARVAAASIVEAAPLALAGLAALALVVGSAVIFVRRRRPALELRKLDAAEARRYVETFASAERDFEARPEVAIAQARGIVEEVLRRMGLPDRVDGAQKARDLAAHDRAAAAALETADRALHQDADRESLRRALTSYREVLDHLLDDATRR